MIKSMEVEFVEKYVGLPAIEATPNILPPGTSEFFMIGSVMQHVYLFCSIWYIFAPSEFAMLEQYLTEESFLLTFIKRKADCDGSICFW